MEVSTAEAKNRFSELIRFVEDGEQVIMKDRIRLLPGWDDPITEEELLGENS